MEIRSNTAVYRKTTKILKCTNCITRKLTYTGCTRVKRKEGRGLSQIRGTYKAETINVAERLNTKYKEDRQTDQFVNIDISHKYIS